jgi:hypothetical protein
MTTYTTAPEVERIADRLIEEHHKHLVGIPIRYVFRDKAASSRGKLVLGKARKSTGLNATLVHLVRHDEPPDRVDFFVIEIALDTWRALTDAQKTALVDHELSHCLTEVPDGLDDDVTLVLAGHDMEEFAAVVRRHGLWRSDLETFMVNSQQPTLHETMAGD